MSKNRTLKRQQERKRLEEEEDDLLKTDKEKELIGIKQSSPVNKAKNKNFKFENQDNDDNEELDIIEEENNNDEQFNKLRDVHKLVLKNKITTKNAFDINQGNVKLDQFSWVNSSNFLQTLSVIHGYKVDNIYQNSYKLLRLMNRTEQAEDEEQNENEDNNEKKQQRKQQDTVNQLLEKANKHKNILNIGERTQEQRPEVLNVVKYDLEFDLDPLFKQTLSKFDDQSNKGLFLTNSYMDKNFIISLESELQEQNDITQQQEEQIEKLQISDTQQQEEEQKESIYMKFVPKENIKGIFEEPQLCPKLMDYKENLEKLANTFKIDYKITESNFQKLIPQASQQKEQQLNEQPIDFNNYGDLMGQLDEIMDNPYQQEDEYEDPNKPQDLQYSDLKKQDQQIEEEEEEQQESISQEEEDEEELELEEKLKVEEEQKENIENSQQGQLDILEMENRLKNIGKGKLDKKLKEKMKAYDENKEKRSRRKKNAFEKFENEKQQQERKKESQFNFNFTDFEELEDKDRVFMQNSKKKIPKIDIKKITLQGEFIHQCLEYVQYDIKDNFFTQLYLTDLPKKIALQQYQQNQTENLEDLEMNEFLQDKFEEVNSSDEEVDFFAQNNKTNEKSQVKIRDLKQNVWLDIKNRFDIIQKKAKGKKETKRKNLPQISDEINFSTILEDIPQMMGPISKKISLQSSFITILHLCNENLLKLEMNDEYSDFRILDDDKQRYDPKNQNQAQNNQLNQQNKNDLQKQDIEVEEKQEDEEEQKQNFQAQNINGEQKQQEIEVE